MRIRRVTTSSGSSAVQVVRYDRGRTLVLKHIGSGKTKDEVLDLKRLAQEWIETKSGQGKLFSSLPGDEGKPLLGKYHYLGFRYGLAEEIVHGILNRFGLKNDSFPSAKIFLDLVIARILEPASKRRTKELLATFFGINYSLTEIYRSLPTLAQAQDLVEEKLILFAKNHLGFEFSFVLYDITTLYFETFAQDEFRKMGFSKDNKVGQPQILVGLVVERNGFPLSFSLFGGNKFEGHTLIPVILDFKKKHHIDNLTVVADAAMISRDNVAALKAAGLNYIVGARMGNTNISLIRDISQKLDRVDGATLRFTTPDDDFLVCSFLTKRYAKDRHEMEKQLDKAKQVLDKKRETIRNKFLARESPVAYCLNKAMMEKTELLLGIKGYRTNLDLPEKEIIERYQDLWRVENAFRISKHDLEARPVYHFRQLTITAHILICVTALAAMRWLEMATGKSARYIVDQLKGVTDARMLNLVTNQETLMRAKIPPETSELLEKIGTH